ncbi:hypothetical protein NLI96_g8437 [Meripilus lineatus]|uniref:Uncharacterized protein n=1 Tax=Meripilus lineatus TaxID=2056292 RepID=A0AAD5UYX8_9APHY|nr:hypothetical protein NLI96_g8437 [Physisporinus lineatus]
MSKPKKFQHKKGEQFTPISIVFGYLFDHTAYGTHMRDVPCSPPSMRLSDSAEHERHKRLFTRIPTQRNPPPPPSFPIFYSLTRLSRLMATLTAGALEQAAPVLVNLTSIGGSYHLARIIQNNFYSAAIGIALELVPGCLLLQRDDSTLFLGLAIYDYLLTISSELKSHASGVGLRVFRMANHRESK